MLHISVLRQEVLEMLDPKPGENFIDGTCGAAGHARDILERLGTGGRLMCFDLDEAALDAAAKKMSGDERVIFINDNFKNLATAVALHNFSPVHGILLDLGFSSDQLEASQRGFSFQKNEPLDMRLNPKQELTAREIVNQWDGRALEKIFQEYGEERRARFISEAIIRFRQIKPIMTTGELVAAIAAATPAKAQHAKLHFATRIFQALRIAVNDELNNLATALPAAQEVLAPGGRLAVISFHSLEDRIVKNFFRAQARTGHGQLLTKKPRGPSLAEVKANPRSRSAKLRAFKKSFSLS